MPVKKAITQIKAPAARKQKGGAAIIAGLAVMIACVPAGIYFILGKLFELFNFGMPFGSTQHIIAGIAAIAIIVIIGIWGNRIISALHKIALLIIFIAIPFGAYFIISRALLGTSQYSKEWGIAFGIVIFILVTAVFKKATD